MPCQVLQTGSVLNLTGVGHLLLEFLIRAFFKGMYLLRCMIIKAPKS